MTTPTGRRERNKQDKLARITAAARELFEEHGADEVTTQQIADRADVAIGTLFFHARTKAELLLLVQNSRYVEALERGRAAAEAAATPLDAVMALVGETVACNRKQVDNGRTYLRELVFGDPAEPHHRAALELAGQAEVAVAEVLTRAGEDPDSAAVRASVVTAVLFLGMATAGPEDSTADVLTGIRTRLQLLVG
ncbi:TetR/AcrR family transcriptional regulator [Klenkia terrae]|jgi:AcrR family transcriptional regulator|uniref:Helix-turn-helix domain-containing protein n=1 Tax=Klenkia terrae TaxID=1052259 RepID=A0ABU8E6L3_9ACTN|nr:TetR/AcrR family transcriptional regulator [Klenkia terrae]SSC25700.1 TetR family transcriptional regulator [Klenkia terrae]